MGKHGKPQAMNGEFELPEVVIQRTQYFLSAKEAAQTTILSKSWNKAWLTRPNLDFDERYFNKGGNVYNHISSDNLLKFAKKTMKRYKKLNQKIDSFRLCMVGREYNHHFVQDLIVKALKMVPTLPVNLNELHNMRRLALCEVNIDALLLGDFSPEFPFLKDLTLEFCHSSQEVVRLSSHSLEHINFVGRKGLRFEFDVPCLRKFTVDRLGSSYNSPLSFKSTSREWETRVSLSFCNLSTLWFQELNDFLIDVSLSKIYFSIFHAGLESSFDYDFEDLEGLPKPEVENLTIEINYKASANCYALFDGLFRICRPKLITQYLCLGRENNDFLHKTLVQGMNEKCFCESHLMSGLHDLEEVNMEIFEKILVQKTSILESLIDDPPSPKELQKVRFLLKWRP